MEGDNPEIENPYLDDNYEDYQNPQGSPISDKIIEELTEENMSDPNWSNHKSQDRASASPPHIEEERILSLTVDIPQGTQEVLEIRASDDIEGITERFCMKHDLDVGCKQMLLDNIRAHLFGTTGGGTIEQQIQEEQLEEDRLDTEPQVEQSELEPRQIEELAGELESWKKEVEQKIREKMAMHNHPIINEHSKRIVEKRGLTRVPVYERLHNKAVVRQKKEKEKPLNVNAELGKRKAIEKKKPQQKNTNVFHHHLLYQRGMKQMHEREKIMEQAIQRKTEKDLAAASFKPKINANSRMMVSRDTERHEDYLLSYGKFVEEKLLGKRLEKDEEELKASFKPSISIMSQRLAAQKLSQRPSSAYNLLYEDAIKRKEKEKNPQPVEFSFTPALTAFDPNMFKGVEKPTVKKAAILDAEKKKEECTFKPKINNIPETIKNRIQGHASVGDYLHNVHKTYTEKVEKKKEEEENKLKEMAKKKFIRGKSIELLGKAEKEKLLEIFKALDSDQDGFISAAKVDITQLSLKLLDIFTPLLSSMEKENLVFSAEDFLKNAYETYKTLTVYDKKAIFDFNRRFRGKEDIEQPTFTPKFDENSLRMSEKRRPPGENHVDIYFKERRESEKKLEFLKRELVQREVEQCTFSPSIIRTRSTKDIIPRNSLGGSALSPEPGRVSATDCTFTAASRRMLNA